MAVVTVLSVKQPWAWLIVNGHKDIENRDWATKFRGELYIHAGKKIDQDGCDWVRENFTEIDLPYVFLTGGIVGKANVIDCVTAHSSRWFFGKHGFVLANQRHIPFVPLRGQLGLFKADI